MSNEKKINSIYKRIYRTPIKQLKEEWEKELKRDMERTNRRLKEQVKNEVLFDGYDYEYKKILNKDNLGE